MKPIKVHLQFRKLLIAGERYDIVKLVNTASIQVASGAIFRIGGSLTPAQADEVAADRRYEVIITSEEK